MFTIRELSDAISEAFDGNFREFYNNISWNSTGIDLSVGTAYRVQDFGGEGLGNELWVVFKIGDRHFRKQGSYDSWEGGEWDGLLQEVEPFEKTVIDYKGIGESVYD